MLNSEKSCKVMKKGKAAFENQQSNAAPLSFITGNSFYTKISPPD
jgi:hypothetical protein